MIAAADRRDDRPRWISVWGGANVLAEALGRVRVTRSTEDLQAFVAKLRVYSISDLDGVSGDHRYLDANIRKGPLGAVLSKRWR